MSYVLYMTETWEVEFTDEFEAWWGTLSELKEEGRIT
jgi:hypothetical protein